MIIVSQDKKHIVNFNNIKEIRLTGNYSIKVDIFEDYELTLGYYKTEERAKEVLQEITDLYKKCEYEKGQYYYKAYGIPKVYEMPEE